MGIKPFDLRNEPMAFFSGAKVICINLNLKYSNKEILIISVKGLELEVSGMCSDESYSGVFDGFFYFKIHQV